jgi:hypothetical protein
MFKIISRVFLILILIFILVFIFIKWKMDNEVASVTPLSMSTLEVNLNPVVDKNHTFKKLPQNNEPQHPFMAITDRSAMHAGSWESDVHPASAVTSENIKIISRRAGGSAARQCATFTFIEQGHPLILCGGLTSFRLQLLHKDTLELLAIYDLPMRPSTFESLVKRDTDIIFTDTSGGAYMYLDNEGRAVLADANQRIRRIKPRQDGQGEWKFFEIDSWDMNKYVPNDCFHWNNLFPKGECDGITTVMPDYNGLLWWVTRNGRVGSLDTKTGKVLSIMLNGEEIQNSFAVDQTGAYIVSDYAMYHMKLLEGMPTQQWRFEYDRGSSRKVGSINQGSGTSPSLFGDNYLTFTDNADDNMNIYVARRNTLSRNEERIICKIPVFKKGYSVTDNSMIAYNRSVILENNSGYTNSMIQKSYSDVVGGVVRVDVREDESGCDKIWTNDLKVPSVVPKLSLGNGIAYFYSFDLLDNGDRLWSLVGLDFETGKEVIRIPTGTGEAFNNNWASIAIAPNGNTWVGTRNGVLNITEH